MASIKKTKRRYAAINANFPADLPDLYDKTTAARDPYSEEVASEFGNPPTLFFSRGEFVPPRANQFRSQLKDEQGRAYLLYATHPNWAAVKLPNRKPTDAEPTEFPEIGFVVDIKVAKFRVLNVILGKTRSTTAMLEIERL